MSFKYHRGGWCGPGWSDGKWQRSKAGYYTAVDEFDQTCKEHDIAYDIGTALKKADYTFYRQNIGRGIKRSAAALGVGTQGYFREADLQTNSIPQNVAVMAPTSRSRSRNRGAENTPSVYVTPQSRGRTRVRSARSLSLPRGASVTPTPGFYRPVRPMSLSGRSLSRTGVPSGSISLRRNIGTQIGTARSYMSGASIAMGGRVATRGSSSKKFSRSRRGKMIKSGVSITTEYGAVATSTAAQQMVTLGHCSVNISALQRAFAAALFKKIFYQAGAVVQGWDDTIDLSGAIGVGYAAQVEINFYYTNNLLPTGANINIASLTALAGATTLDGCVGWFCSTSRPWFPDAADDSPNQFQFIKVSLNTKMNTPAAAIGTQAYYVAPTSIWLERASVQFETKSSMKFQNRSSAVNTDADAVDNIPLYGKFYEGSGNGINPKSSKVTETRLPLTGNATTGVIAPDPALVVTAGYKEPPQPSLFKCSKFGKVNFPPGYVKSSVLVTKKSMGFNRMFRLLFDDWTLDSTTGINTVSPLGSYRLFMVEKILQAGTGDSQALNLAYECNTDTYLSMKGGRSVEAVAKFISTV